MSKSSNNLSSSNSDILFAKFKSDLIAKSETSIFNS